MPGPLLGHICREGTQQPQDDDRECAGSDDKNAIRAKPMNEVPSIGFRRTSRQVSLDQYICLGEERSEVSQDEHEQGDQVEDVADLPIQHHSGGGLGSSPN